MNSIQPLSPFSLLNRMSRRVLFTRNLYKDVLEVLHMRNTFVILDAIGSQCAYDMVWNDHAYSPRASCCPWRCDGCQQSHGAWHVPHWPAKWLILATDFIITKNNVIKIISYCCSQTIEVSVAWPMNFVQNCAWFLTNWQCCVSPWLSFKLWSNNVQMHTFSKVIQGPSPTVVNLSIIDLAEVWH